MIVEVGQDEKVAKWLKNIGTEFCPPFVTMCIIENDQVVAAAVFNNYQASNIDLSVVFAKRIALTRGNLRALFAYPFKQLGVNRISVRTHSNNMSVRKQIRRLGFEPEGKKQQFYGNESAIEYGMVRSQCKWL